MEIGSSGAGSLAQTTPTQTGSQQEVVKAESQQKVEQTTSDSQASTRQSDGRVGSVIDIEV